MATWVRLMTGRRWPAWAETRPWVADTMLAVVLVALSLCVAFGLGETIESDILRAPATLPDWVLLLGPTLAVPFRRITPSTAAVVGAVLQAALWLTDLPDYYVAQALLIFSAAAHGGVRGRRVALAVSSGLTAYTALGVLSDNAPAYAVVVVGLFGAAATALGTSFANRQAYVREVEARARDTERTRLASQERALTAERNRIARELHDVVAHGLSVIVVQAAAAQRILDRDPAGARSALGQIEQTGRNALTEMRHVLSVVRTDPDDSWRPAPGLDGLSELIDELGAAGLAITVTVTDDDAPLPATVDLTAFRIVQESLTNVLKHGGPGAAVKVDIVQTASSLDLAIVDNGRGAAAANGGGYGLRGMQERVEVFGGTFSAGPRLGGGFSVAVSLPLDGSRAEPSATNAQ